MQHYTFWMRCRPRSWAQLLGEEFEGEQQLLGISDHRCGDVKTKFWIDGILSTWP